MPYLEWNETYLTNIRKIDDDHQKLVSLVNDLYASIYECQNIDEKHVLIGKILTELIAYSYYHFEVEEELMLTYEYPNYTSHKEQHEYFKIKITQLMNQHKNGTLIWSFPILNYLRDWIRLHILDTDKQYIPYLSEKMRSK